MSEDQEPKRPSLYLRKKALAQQKARADQRQRIIDSYITDLGGPEAVSSADRALVGVIATLSTQITDLDAKFASGTSTDDDLSMYNRLAGNLRRLIASLPKHKPSAQRPPTLDEVRKRYES